MCLQIHKPISLKLVANYFPRRFRPQICTANPHTFRPRHEKEAKVKLSMAKHDNKIYLCWCDQIEAEKWQFS